MILHHACCKLFIVLAVSVVDSLRITELTEGRHNKQILYEHTDASELHNHDELRSGSGFQSLAHFKLLLLIGDSVDRYAVDDWCEAQRHEGARLLYGQDPDNSFGKWSKMGHVDDQLLQMLKSSGVTAWMSWSVRVCIVPRRGVAVASIFNLKGVDQKGPWWHQDIIEEKYGIHPICGPDNSDPSCHDFVKFLRPPVQAIQTRLSLAPETTVINSNFWDVSRVAYYGPRHINFTSYAYGTWTSDAKRLIEALTKVLPPKSRLLWRTANLPEDKDSMFLVETGVVQEEDEEEKRLEDEDEEEEGEEGGRGEEDEDKAEAEWSLKRLEQETEAEWTLNRLEEEDEDERGEEGGRGDEDEVEYAEAQWTLKRLEEEAEKKKITQKNKDEQGKKTTREGTFSELDHEGSRAYYMVQKINAAARQLCRDQGIQLVDVEPRNYACRDRLHPSAENLVQLVDELLRV